VVTDSPEEVVRIIVDCHQRNCADAADASEAGKLGAASSAATPATPRKHDAE